MLSETACPDKSEKSRTAGKMSSVLLIIIFCFTTNIFSQVQFTPHTIVDGENDPRSPFSIYSVDVDSDGDIDVLSASTWDDKIAWYENDSNQNFTLHIITTNADYANSVFAIDVDGDGNIDEIINMADQE